MSVHVSFLRFLCSNLFSDTSQTSEVSDDAGLVDDEIGSTFCTEIPEIQPDPEGLEALEEEIVKTEDTVLLTEPEQRLEDVGKIKDIEELNSEDGISVIIMTPCEEGCSTILQSETNDPVLEVDSKPIEEAGRIQESELPQPGIPPDLVCDALEAEDSKNVIASEETLEIENAETFVELHNSVCPKQEEATCEDQIESAVEVEPHGHKEQLIQLSDCSEHLKDSEESNHELLLGEETSEGSKQSICNETKTSDRTTETQITVAFGSNPTENPNETEVLDQLESSTEAETSQLSESKDSKETGQQDALQQNEQENHINSEQQQTHDKDSVGQTGKVSSEHGTEEQQQISAEPSVTYKNGNGDVVDREEACKLAERLYRLDNVQRTDVVKHLDKE